MTSRTLWIPFVLLASSIWAGDQRVHFVNGRELAITSAEAIGERWRLQLASGGILEVDQDRIDSFEEIRADPPAAPVVLAVVASPFPSPSAKLMAETPYDDWIAGLAARHGVEPMLVRAVVLAESHFDDDARSRAGALGLMQLMPATARELGCTNRLDPVANLDCGIRYLKQMLELHQGNVEWALAAYNAGPDAVRKYGGIPPYPETRAYVRRILDWLGGDV